MNSLSLWALVSTQLHKPEGLTHLLPGSSGPGNADNDARAPKVATHVLESTCCVAAFGAPEIHALISGV